MTLDQSDAPVPEDFPTEDPPGAVSGAHPKLLLMQVGDRYTTRPADSQRRADWIRAEDMAQQMKAYCTRKLAEGAVKDEAAALARGLNGLRGKPWFNDAQNIWIMGRAADLLNWPRLSVESNRCTWREMSLEEAIDRGIVRVGPPDPRPRVMSRVEELMRASAGEDLAPARFVRSEAGGAPD